MSRSRYYNATLAAQVILLVYFEACVLIPLGRWNDQPGHVAFSPGNIVLGSAIGFAQGLLLVGTIWRVKTLLWLGLAGDSMWMALHIQGLWMPYVVGATPEYERMYVRVFSHTTKLLPNFDNHLAPDAMHTFIDLFLVAVIVTLCLYIRSLRPQATSKS